MMKPAAPCFLFRNASPAWALLNAYLGDFVFVAFFFFVTNRSFATLTPIEIVHGISSQQEKLRTLDVHYTVTIENNDAFFTWVDRQNALYAKQGFPNRRAALPSFWTGDRRSSTGYRIVSDGNRREFEVYALDSGSPQLIQHGVYDGEVQRQISAGLPSNALTQRISPDQFISFETPSTLLRPEQGEIAGFLDDKSWNASTEAERIDGDDVIEVLTLRKDVTPSPNIIASTIYIVEINVSKDFWPQRIEERDEVGDLKAHISRQDLRKVVTVGGFIDLGGLSYPKSIQKTLFTGDFRKVPGTIIQQLIRAYPIGTETLAVSQVLYNKKIDPSLFSLTYPKGTELYDDIAHVSTVVVNPISQLSPDTQSDLATVAQQQYPTFTGMPGLIPGILFVGVGVIGICAVWIVLRLQRGGRRDG